MPSADLVLIAPDYTTLQFNALPGWARDAILALEQQRNSLAEALNLLALNVQTAARDARAHGNEFRSHITLQSADRVWPGMAVGRAALTGVLK